VVEHVGDVAPDLEPLVGVEDEVGAVRLLLGPEGDPDVEGVVAENGDLERKKERPRLVLDYLKSWRD